MAKRADAQRNLDSLLEAAKTVFAEEGVDAPIRTIAEKAGVGIGTLYRHFPQRADLVVAVFRREIDACISAASDLARQHPPNDALALWLQRFALLVATKRGLAGALHSEDPAYTGLHAYFEQHLRPAAETLWEAADTRPDATADDVLRAVSSLCMSAYSDGPEYVQRMVAILADGLFRR